MAEWLTAREAALNLKVRPATFLLWARQGKIPAHRLSGIRRHVWRFKREELDAVLTDSQTPAVIHSALSSADSAEGRQQ
jgi:excisionase family DNA binding protein